MKQTVYSVFGNQVRAKFILCLAHKPKNVSEIMATCKLSQSAVSQHLSKLKQAGLVNVQKQGKEVWYSLKYSKAARVSTLLIALEQEVL